MNHSNLFDSQSEQDQQLQQQQMQQQNVSDAPQPVQQQVVDNNNSSSLARMNNENEGVNQQPKRTYRRHTYEQIQALEASFEKCPYPNVSQKEQLGRMVGLDPMQVKFWFQNKHTQLKTRKERHQNDLLRDENAKLRAEIEKLKNAKCPNCEGSMSIGEMSFRINQLRIENARLKARENEMQGQVQRNVGNNGGSNYSIGQMSRPSSIPNNNEKQMIMELAFVSMEELKRLTLAGAPLLISTIDSEILNEDEYFRVFSNVMGPKIPGLKSEFSRESLIVNMNHIKLIETLMDVNQWSSMFPSIVSKAMILEVLSPIVSGNYSGVMQVMSANFQVPSPLVPARENYFVRYCKKHENGKWAVVDVSLDHLRPGCSATLTRSRRRPSGCFIEELPNGFSKVTWVEHVEVNDNMLSSYKIYKSLVTSCLAFGAKRWVGSLDRECDRLAFSMATTIPPGDYCAFSYIQARKILLDLAERMKMCFFTSVGSSVPSCWNVLTSASDDVRVMTRTKIGQHGTSSIVVCVGTSLWLPVLPKRLFDFLGNRNSRTLWDILSIGAIINEIAHIGHGVDIGDCVSVFNINNEISNQNNMLIQDTSINNNGAYVIYAPVDFNSMNTTLNSGDTNVLGLIPSGFVILPDGVRNGNDGPLLNAIGSGGCLLTISFQILVESSPTQRIPESHVESVVGLIKNTTERIKIALACDRVP